MTLAEKIESILGESRFKEIRDHKFSDTASGILGERGFNQLKKSLHQILVDHQFSNPGVGNAARKTYELLKEFGDETAYGFIVDAVAQNITSLVYVLNDRFRAGQTWRAVLGTRINAAIGNTLTGRPYGAWQDYIITKADDSLGITEDPNKYRKFMKIWASKIGAFATGQSWLYALFLMGGNSFAGEPTDYEKLMDGVATLTIAAPLLGPYSDLMYQEVRRQFGLPPVPKYRLEKQLQSAGLNEAANHNLSSNSVQPTKSL